jgi:hypothetical protein
VDQCNPVQLQVEVPHHAACRPERLASARRREVRALHAGHQLVGLQAFEVTSLLEDTPQFRFTYLPDGSTMTLWTCH